MDWTAVDSQAVLDQLDRSICWEDSEAVRFHGSPLNRADYPADVSRSGFVNKNVHVVIDTCSSRARFIELVFIDCDHIGTNALEHLHLGGRIDSLKRVEITDASGVVILRCSRLAYRWLDHIPSNNAAQSSRAVPLTPPTGQSFEPPVRIDYPIQWDDRDNFERPSKGWLDGVIVTAVDGSRHELSFYDPVRLQQDLEEAIAQGRVGIVERGLMVIPEVTKENIEKAIRQASAAGYFHRGSDGGSQSE